MISRIWSAVAVTSFLALAPGAQAAPAACISDAELEETIGAEVKAGAAAVSTTRLGNRPLCSGLGMAQAIQQLRARYFPAQAAPAPPPEDPVREPADDGPSGEGPSAEGRSVAANWTMGVLDKYVGQSNLTRINGKTFLEQPAVISALTRAGVPPMLRRSLERYDVGPPVDREGDIIMDGGCIAHHCDSNHYRLFIAQGSRVAALCVFQVTESIWYSPMSGGRTVIAPETCPENPADAPARIRAALGLRPSYGGY